MPTLINHWQRALALLDQALDLRQEQREAWLVQTTIDEPDAVQLVRKLLVAHGRVETHEILATLPKVMRSAPSRDGGAAGMTVGPFELIEALGRGGMGSVWRARYADGRLKRDVAVKLPASTDDATTLATLRERFARERDFLAQLQHPHIARLYDAGVSEQGQPFLAMEYVAGRPIDDYCDAQRLTVKARLRLFEQVLDAVAYAHQQLVLHRDLKADNVLVDEQGQVRLLDFGVARLLPPPQQGPAAAQPGADAELTERAGAAFTLGYAAPEQVSHGPLSTATDVYALGVLLYRLLTGLSPYQPTRDTRGGLEDAVLLATPETASTRAFLPQALEARQCSAVALRKALRDDLDVILGKALKKLPAERYATVTAMAEDLRRHLAQQPISARADSWWYRSSLFVARHRLAVGATALASVALITTAGVAAWQAKVSAENAARANREAARANTAQKFFAGLLSNADPEKNKNVTAVDRQVMDQALAEAEVLFAEAPDTLVIVLRQLGEIYDRMGNSAKHLLVQKKRVALLRSMPGVGADEVVDANVKLGYALYFSDLPEERQQALPKSIAAQEMAVALSASADLQVRSLCGIADLYLFKGDYGAADELAERAVKLAEQKLPRPHPELARAYDQRGATATRLGKFAAARQSFAEAMKVGSMPPARGKSAQLNSQINLANTEFMAGNYLASKREALSAIDYANRNLGGNEPILTTLRVRAALASVRAGQLQEAKLMANTSFAGDLASDDPFRVGRAQYVKGVVSMALGDFQAASQAFSVAESALAIVPRWKSTLEVQQAILKLKLGQAEAAHHALQELLVRIRAGAEHQRELMATAAEVLGVASVRVQQTEFARSLFNEACESRRLTLDVLHPDRLRCESYIVLLTERLGTAEKRHALEKNLQVLKDREDRPAMTTALERTLKWLESGGNGEQHMRAFPLLD